SEIDWRPLGVVLVRVNVSATSGGLLIPPLWQLVVSLICVAATYTTMRGVGVTRWGAWVVAALLALMLVLALARWPLQVAPFTVQIAGLLLMLALYAMAVGALARSNVAGSAASIALIDGLLLMGLAFWLMPIYQLIMTLDGTPAVTPYPPTLWVTIGVVLASALGLRVLAARRSLHRWRQALLGVLAVAAVIHLAVMIEYALGRSGPDFWILFRGAREWFRGNALYDLQGVIENHFGHVLKVPPFYAMLFVPFVQQDGLMILFWHRMINIGLLVLTLVLLLTSFRIRLFSILGAGLLLLFNMRPLADTIAFGQIDILLLLLLTMALIALQRSRDGIAGIAVALGTLFKLYPALLLIFFITQRQWRAVISFFLTLLLCTGFAVVVMGWDVHMTYLLDVLPRIGGGTSWVENQTINGFLSRLFAPNIVAAKFEHPVVTLLTIVAFLALLGLAVALAWRHVPASSTRLPLLFGLFVLLMVLAVPAAWMHYQTITILTFFSLLLASQHAGMTRWQAAMLGLAYALIAYGNQWSFYNNSITSGLTVLGTSYKFYGLLLLLVLVLWQLVHGADATQADEKRIAA
ncbi:MAG: DUF2029 domain-containing protein, partial [Chloroflexaceae bacterium]|nr:DUF2029 domain-containing protein [Chloroflexaceae bacterium]